MNNFVFQYDETRKQSGVGGAVYFKRPDDMKYSFAFACGTIPSSVGDVDTYDSFIITEKYKGKTEGQQSLEKIDLPVVWHRDMKARCIELAEMKELDFLIIAPDYTAEQITGTLSYKRGDLGDSTLEGTVSITPNSMSDDKILNARGMLQGTVKFEKNGTPSIIPDTINLAFGDSVSEVSLPLDTGVTVITRILDGVGKEVVAPKLSVSAWTADTAEKLVFTGSNGTGKSEEFYLVEIKISKKDNQSWKQTIAVNVPIGTKPI